MIGASYTLLLGDALQQLRALPDDHFHAVCTSPPYWSLRDYGVDGQIGMEGSLAEYLEKLVEVFREVRRVLRPDATCWVNMGDGFTSGGRATRAPDAKNPGREMGARPPTPDGLKLKPKDLIGMPWRLAFALQADGWWLRDDIIWSKPNAQPEAVEDRPTRAHEYIFLLSKSADYFYDSFAVMEPTTGNAHHRGTGVHRKAAGAEGTRQNASYSAAVTGLVEKRNLRTVWTIQTQATTAEHYAAFPVRIPSLCILAGTSEKGCCATCGAPWERVVEKVRTVDGEPAELPPRKSQDLEAPSQAQGIGHGRIATRRESLGWKPTCAHDDEPVPCRVLDPFCGTGTTGEAALALGRSFTGIELKPEYLAISERRLAGVNPLFTRRAGT